MHSYRYIYIYTVFILVSQRKPTSVQTENGSGNEWLTSNFQGHIRTAEKTYMSLKPNYSFNNCCLCSIQWKMYIHSVCVCIFLSMCIGYVICTVYVGYKMPDYKISFFDQLSVCLGYSFNHPSVYLFIYLSIYLRTHATFGYYHITSWRDPKDKT